MVTVAPENTPIKVRGAWFGHSNRFSIIRIAFFTTDTPNL
jgi:hypothetical protein